MMKAYSVDPRNKIVEAVKKGVSMSETARRFGVNRSRVSLSPRNPVLAVLGAF
jgi:transposase-like protein